jgi:hypothetical protein
MAFIRRFKETKGGIVMKANETPEKIYMSPAGVLYKDDKQNDKDVEYTRTDAFIEKAAEWLDNFYNEDTNSYLIDEDIESFIDYMEGE